MTKCLSQREREREKSTPVQCLGFKRKKEGEKKRNHLNTLFWGETTTNITHDDK